MAKRIVVLMEGTGNALDRNASNVTRMLEFMEVGLEQMAIWDYGVGTRWRSLDEAGRQREGMEWPDHPDSLFVLAPPRRAPGMPRFLAKGLGLAMGYGLKANVAEAVAELAAHYCTGDELFLFGFSRGAFTVRVLAALMWRFGLPGKGVDDVHAWVATRLSEMQSEARFEPGSPSSVPTHFLGLWDTVKAYGFIRPVRYFHLRHNPGVRHVRHALALDEKRSWFQPTTWGGLDRDPKQRDGRHPDCLRDWKPAPNPEQTVREVWFGGCHSDIGGGGDPRECRNGEIALRWMLCEAREAGLALNDKGRTFVAQNDPSEPVVPTESWKGGWRLTDYVPRLEIDNDWSPARLRPAFGHTGLRDPRRVLRGGRAEMHPTVDAKRRARYAQQP